MKKIIIAFVAMAMSMTCLADEVPALKVKTDKAESTILLKEINKVKYSETEMIIKLNDGTEKVFVMDNIQSLTFDNVNETTAISDVDSNTQAVIELFDLNGMKRQNTNGKGIYIIKVGKETKKIIR